MPLANVLELHSVMDIILRVPTVFVMDALLHSSHAFPKNHVPEMTTVSSERDQTNSESGLEFTDWNLSQLGIFSIKCIGFLVTFILFTLHTKTLIQAYKWLTSLFAIMGSYWMNSLFLIDQESSTHRDSFNDFVHHFFLQSLFALVFSYSYVGPRYRPVLHLSVATIVLPSLFRLWPTDALPLPWKSVPVISASVGLACVGCSVNLHHFYIAAKFAIQTRESIVRRHGLHVLLENEWLRLRIPHVLRLFWLVRFSEHIVFQIANVEKNPDDLAPASFTIEALVNTLKTLLVQGCDTIVAVLGMTSVVSSGAHYLSCAVQQFLAADDDDEKSFGTVSAILFFILALQTGLTGLEPEKRFTRLYRNFCLLSTAILHFVHNMVNPLLMSLSASRNRSISHHARALVVCAFLVIFPCWFLTYLWRTHQVSTWLLAVSAFSIEVTIKVIISLLIYILFMIDSYHNAFWERLDDYVYYVRAIGNTIEFIFGIFLLFNGAWILLFESGGTIRACMMGIHAYFNIWMQAKAGWKVFMRRRTAVNQINSFPEATEKQLQELNDVCAICYQEMSTARITWCQHYFHALCLRKWLYIQDRCPMCHKAIYETEIVENAGDVGELERQANENELQRPHLQVVNRDGSQQRNALEHEHQD